MFWTSLVTAELTSNSIYKRVAQKKVGKGYLTGTSNAGPVYVSGMFQPKYKVDTCSMKSMTYKLLFFMSGGNINEV
jgi:hypothetical protein